MKTPLAVRRPLVLLVCLLAAGCASTSPPSATGPAAPAAEPEASMPMPAAAVPDLTDRAMLLMMVDRQMYEPGVVRRILGTASHPAKADLRLRLAEALGQIGDPRGVEPLRGLTLDEDPRVRRAAVFSLGELEEQEGTRVLRRALTDDDPETGALAVEALAKLGTPLATVQAGLGPLDEDEARRRLLPYLFRFPETAKVAVAEAALDTPERALAAYALGRDALAEGAPALRGLVDDPDPWIRAWAARGLGTVGDGSDLARLRPLLGDTAAGPVIQALRAGAALVADGRGAAPDDWRPALRRLLDDPRPHARLSALEVAGAWLLDPELGPALVARAEGGGEPWERRPALLALAGAGHPSTPGLAQTLAQSPDPVLRETAATAAGLLADLELLDRLRHDPQPRVRVAALDGLLTVTLAVGDPDDVQDLVRTALTDTDPAVRASLFSWLADNPVAPVESLGEAVVQSLTDRNAESSVFGVRAILARAQAESLERGTLVALLENLAEYRDFLVRREAAAALEELGRPRPSIGVWDKTKTAAVYESLVRQTWRPVRATIRTTRGPVTVELDCPGAPLTCHNFMSLAGQGFYDGLPFHRVVPDFVVQGGDPRGDGYGGPPYTIPDEIHRLRYDRGVMGMALAGPDTGGSQFFFTLSPQPHLDGGYTTFGRVLDGFEVLESIVPGDELVGIDVADGS
jgi:cyclophilin family peptidyl-prolyl cis-trans isomerase/HEAT repeat protein